MNVAQQIAAQNAPEYKRVFKSYMKVGALLRQQPLHWRAGALMCESVGEFQYVIDRADARSTVRLVLDVNKGEARIYDQRSTQAGATVLPKGMTCQEIATRVLGMLARRYPGSLDLVREPGRMAGRSPGLQPRCPDHRQ